MYEEVKYLNTWEERMAKCRSDRERDEVTNYWLQCNDPYYSDTDKDKMDKIEYPYHTRNRSRVITKHEVPESTLNFKGTLEARKKGMAENKEID